MIVLEHKQGSEAWRAARLGIPTASQFDRIYTPSTRKPSTQQAGYIHELLAETMTGIPHDAGSNSFMDRGRQLEPEARTWYAFEHGVEVREVGLVLRDDRMTACSPDGLIGEDRGLEVKCYGAANHVRCLLDGLSGHWCQIQGSLWITEREHWDLLAYHPEMPSIVTPVGRDEKFIDGLAAEVNAFIEKLLAARDVLLARGCTPRSLMLTSAMVGANHEPF